MRIDKFINSVNITKRRAVAQDMLKNSAVLLNGVVAKPSKEVKVLDIITVLYLNRSIEYKILKIPLTKSIPKSLKSAYVEELQTEEL